jgi:predicted ArsR family transcriptional regulator
MKSATVVLEEILTLLSESESLTVDEIARATELGARDVRKTLDVLATTGFVQLEEDRATIDPVLREIMLSEEQQ